MIVNTMKKRKLFILVFLLTIFSACQDRDDLVQVSIEDGNNVLSLQEYEFISTGGELALAFTANTSWTLTGCPSWLNIKDKYKSGRAGTTTIIMSVDCNETRKGRDAVLTFAAKDGSFESTMKISQPYPYLKINTDSLHFNWNDCRMIRDGVELENNPQKINISSNVQWKIKEVKSTKTNVDFSHFTLSADSGENDYELSVIPIKDNFNKEPYDLQVKLYSVYYDEDGNEFEISSEAADSYIIKLHQRNLKFLINGSPDDGNIEFSELNDDPNINFNIDAEVKWTVAEKPSWVVLKQTNNTDGTINVNFLADGANPATSLRDGVVKLSTGAIGAYRYINVSQKPYVFELDNSSKTIGNDDLTSITRTLKTTGTWEIKSCPEWLSITPENCEVTTPESGKDSHEITFAAKAQNLEFSNKVGEIVVKSTMNDLEFRIPVSQDKFIFDVTPDAKLSNLPTMNVDKYDVTIDSSGPWDIIGIPEEWVAVSKDKADVKGEETIQVGPTNGNPDLDNDRIVTLKVVSRAHKDAGITVEREIKVKQRKFTFEISKTQGEKVTIPAYKTNWNNYFYVDVQCSSDWELIMKDETSYISWIDADKESGDGTQDVTIYFTPETNTNTGADRHAVITVKSLYNNQEKSFEVQQDKFVFDAKPIDYPELAVMNPDLCDASFSLTAEASWQLVQCPGWLTLSMSPGVSPSSGLVDLKIQPKSNPETVARRGEVVIQSVVTGEQKTISFSQLPYQFDSNPESFDFTELDTKKEFFDVLSSGKWKIENKPSWINFQSEGNLNNSPEPSTTQLSVAKNTSTSPREATFNIVSDLNPSLNKAVTVKQEAYLFEIISGDQSYNYETLEERMNEITFVCSGDWDVEGPEWITINREGNGSESGEIQRLTITSKENLTEENRTAVLKVVSKDNNDLSASFSLSQNKFDFRVSQTAFEYVSPLDQTESQFNVICPAEWEVASNADWLTFNASTATGNGEVTFNPAINTNLTSREATLTVTSTRNGLKRSVKVTQPAFIFSVDKTALNFASPIASKNSPLAVNVNCSERWTVESRPDWVTLSTTEGIGNGGFDVSVTTNEERASREGKIVVRSVLGGHTHEIKITQEAFVFDSNTLELTFNPYEPQSQNFEVTASAEWEVVTSSDWIEINPESGAENGRVTVKPKNNVGNTERRGEVTVLSGIGGYAKVVKVVQSPYVFEVNSDSLTNFEAYDENSQTITLKCSGTWTATSDSNWLSVSAGSGRGNSDIKLTVTSNESVDSRNATVTIRSEHYEKVITVTQKGVRLNVPIESLTFEYNDTKEERVHIDTNGPWNAVSSQEWCELSINDQNILSGELKVWVKENTIPEERTAVITITSRGSLITRTITVTQKAGPMPEPEPEQPEQPNPNPDSAATGTTKK